MSFLSKQHLKKMTLVNIIIFLTLLFINTLSNLGLTAEANEKINILRKRYKVELKDPKYFKPGLPAIIRVSVNALFKLYLKFCYIFSYKLEHLMINQLKIKPYQYK